MHIIKNNGIWIWRTWGNFATRQNKANSNPWLKVISALIEMIVTSRCHVNLVSVVRGNYVGRHSWDQTHLYLFISPWWGQRKGSIYCRVIYWTNENVMKTFQNWTVWETNMTRFWERLNIQFPHRQMEILYKT